MPKICLLSLAALFFLTCDFARSQTVKVPSRWVGGPVILSLASPFELIAFKPSGKEYREPARINVAEAPVYAHPVVAGNPVFVKDEDSLTLWTAE